MIFEIDGYWSDDHTEFEKYLVNEFDDCPEGMNDDEIFFYGLSEDNIKEAIKSKDEINNNFVITSYEKFRRQQNDS